MHSATTVTKENFPEMESRAIRLESNRMKKLRIRRVCMPVGNIIFTLCFLLCTLGFMYSVSTPVELAAISTLEIPTKLWTDFVALLPAELPWYFALLIGVAASVVVSIVACVLIALLVGVIPGKKAEGSNSGIELTKAKSLVESCERINAYVPDLSFTGKKLTSVIYAGLCLVFFFYFMWKAYRIDPETAEPLSAQMILGMVIATGLFLLLFVLIRGIVNRLTSLLYSVKKDSDLEKAAKAYLKECKEQDKAEKERLRKKHEREEMIRRDKEKREKMAQAAELYAQAMAEETPDEKLIYKAADMGDPDACLYVGKQLVTDWSSGMYTSKEKNGIIKRAARYLENATGNLEGEFLWLFSRVNHETNGAKEWGKILNRLRSIHKSGELPEQYMEVCETTIQTLVDTVDTLAEREEEQRREQEQQRREQQWRESRRKCRCKFAAGAMCTYYSTSSYVSKCDYLNNPGSCAAALNNRGLEFYYD